jgi:multidrug resistance efflux pump
VKKDSLVKALRHFFHDTVPKAWGSFKKNLNLPIIIVSITGLIGLYHVFSYLVPFTDNAFVVTNITPVAADVSGFITDIHVKNGQAVKKDQPIFTVYQKPYQLAHQQTSADYAEGIKKIPVFEKQIAQTQALIQSTKAELGKIEYELKLKKAKRVAEAVSLLELKKLNYDAETLSNKVRAFQGEIEVIRAKIDQQRHTIASLKAKRDNAKINLDLTVVRAPGNGVIDNMYLAPNTPIKIHEPVLSFIDTSSYYIQANFNETDLRNVRVGDKAYILLRMYYFDKVFHGVVVNSLWGVERQKTAPKSQLQLVSNENEWLLLPQRFPIQIKITDPDPDFPLNPGASAYVYISTNR